MMSRNREEAIDPQEKLARDLEEESKQYDFNAIALGVEAKKFLTSDLARYITDIAESNVRSAHNALANVDPMDVKEIVKQQTIVGIYDHYKESLYELVAAGETAYQKYLEGLSTDE